MTSTPSPSVDYETLLAELHRQADLQRDLVEALCAAAEHAIEYKGSGLDALTGSVRVSAREELVEANAKLKRQVAFIERIERQRRADDYETVLAELRCQIDAQRELVEALTAAVEFAIQHRGSGLDALTDPFRRTARNDLAKANAKMKYQFAYYEMIQRRRDMELLTDETDGDQGDGRDGAG